MDPQQVEILGRNLLITELVRAGVEVAMPLRDHGVDLIAYLDIDEQLAQPSVAKVPRRFVGVPIQMKAATEQRFSLHKKYARISNLLLVYVWNVGGEAPPEFYALTYAQALSVADTAGWTATNSWTKDRGKYSATHVSTKLKALLTPYRMTTELWKQRLRDMQ